MFSMGGKSASSLVSICQAPLGFLTRLITMLTSAFLSDIWNWVVTKRFNRDTCSACLICSHNVSRKCVGQIELHWVVTQSSSRPRNSRAPYQFFVSSWGDSNKFRLTYKPQPWFNNWRTIICEYIRRYSINNNHS